MVGLFAGFDEAGAVIGGCLSGLENGERAGVLIYASGDGSSRRRIRYRAAGAGVAVRGFVAFSDSDSKG